MIPPELLSYISTERAKNTPDSIIKSNLLLNGWSEADYTEAINAINASVGSNVPLKNDPAILRYRRHKMWGLFSVAAFLTILSYVLNYISLRQISGSSVYRSYDTYGLFSEQALYVAIGLVSFLISSYLVTRGIRPKDAKWKEWIDFIIRFIGAIAISMFVSFALFFAVCLFGFSGMFF